MASGVGAKMKDERKFMNGVLIEMIIKLVKMIEGELIDGKSLAEDLRTLFKLNYLIGKRSIALSNDLRSKTLFTM